MEDILSITAFNQALAGRHRSCMEWRYRTAYRAARSY
jgi:hypothetical protein